MPDFLEFHVDRRERWSCLLRDDLLVIEPNDGDVVRDRHTPVAKRIDDAARFVARDQLGLSTQCGFASIAAGNPITEADEERKLRLVADTAHAVWG